MVVKQLLLNVVLTIVLMVLMNLLVCSHLEQSFAYIVPSFNTAVMILVCYLPLFLLLLDTWSRSRLAIVTVHLLTVMLMAAAGFFLYRVAVWYSDDPMYVMVLGFPFYLTEVLATAVVCIFSLFRFIKKAT